MFSQTGFDIYIYIYIDETNSWYKQWKKVLDARNSLYEHIKISLFFQDRLVLWH